jgi:hypothetical protein
MPDEFVMTEHEYVQTIFGESAKRLGSGAQASVFLVKNDAVLERLFEKLRHRTGTLPRSRYVCLKIRVPVFSYERPGSNRRWNRVEWARNEILEFNAMSNAAILKVWRHVVGGGRDEFRMLKYTHDQRGPQDPCWFRPSDMVPTPYFQGVDMDHGVHILAMEMKHGVRFSRYASKTSAMNLVQNVINLHGREWSYDSKLHPQVILGLVLGASQTSFEDESSPNFTAR